MIDHVCFKSNGLLTTFGCCAEGGFLGDVSNSFGPPVVPVSIYPEL
jgi:hypothetical protein